MGKTRHDVFMSQSEFDGLNKGLTIENYIITEWK